MQRNRSENDWNAALRSELLNRGLEAVFDTHIPVGGSKRPRPDVHFFHEGDLYVVEGKKAPVPLAEAIRQGLGYREDLRAAYQCDTVFAVRYPADGAKNGVVEAAVLSIHPPHYLVVSFDDLSGCVDWISGLATSPMVADEVPAEAVIRTLRSVVRDLSGLFAEMEPQDVSDLFGGNDVFSSVMGYAEESDIPIERLRSAVAFILVNQILSYEVLAQHSRLFSPIDPETLESCVDLQQRHFDLVLEVNYRPIFSFRVAAEMTSRESLPFVRLAVIQLKLLLPYVQDRDLLGKVFHSLIPLGLRKLVAAYYTNDRAAELLARLAIRTPGDRVTDAACGSGTLLVAAYARKAALSGGEMTPERHRRFLQEELTGIDIMPFAAHLAAINLIMQEPRTTIGHIRIGIRDSTTLDSESVVSSSEKQLKQAFRSRTLSSFDVASPTESVSTGSVELSPGSSGSFRMGSQDVVMMNPPFTRSERIPKEYKGFLDRIFTSYSSFFTRKLNLHGYFVFLADRLLGKGGRMALILPLSSLGIRSHLRVVEFLFSSYSIDHVIVSRGRAAFSEQASFREILLVARKGVPAPEHMMRVTQIAKSPAEWTAFDVALYHEVLVSAEFDAEPMRFVRCGDVQTVQISQAKLREGSLRELYNVASTFGPLSQEAYLSFQSVRGKTSVLSPFDQVVEASGQNYRRTWEGLRANEFSVLCLLPSRGACHRKCDVWYILAETQEHVVVRHRVTGCELTIPLEQTVPCFRQISGLNRVDCSDVIGRIVVAPSEPVLTALLEATFLGNCKEIETVGARIRGKWIGRGSDIRTHLVMPYKLNLAASGTFVLAVTFREPVVARGQGWIFPEMSYEDALLVSLWMNSTFFLLDLLVNCKAEVEGAWMRFNKYLHGTLTLLDPTALSSDQRRDLLDLCARTNRVELLPLFQQLNTAPKIDLDARILQILGIPDEEADVVAGKVNVAVRQAVLDLKGAM